MRFCVCRFASFQISHEGQTHTIFVDIPSSFPEEQPCLSLRVRPGNDIWHHNRFCSLPHFSCRQSKELDTRAVLQLSLMTVR